MPRTYHIHPAIGVARVGDSPDDYFVGPEAPGVPLVLNKADGRPSKTGKYKDEQQRIKRQGARFRIYEYTHDEAGGLTHVREITAADAVITWEVHLVNRKAAAPKFLGQGRRNEGVPEQQEQQLIIDAGKQHISGVKQAMRRLQGQFESIDVALGDLLTDKAGRLIVLGGFGKSQSPSRKPIPHFADNDGWCDDTSDGPVRATIRLNDSAETLEADSAWVIVAPPDFAPPIENIVTMFDVVYNMMAKFDPSLAITDATPVSFTRDIYPILRRVSNMHWVSEVAVHSPSPHGPGKKYHFLSRLPFFASNQLDSATARKIVFQELRNPQGGGGSMPKLPASTDPKTPGVSLTDVQYARMKRWAEGKFEANWPSQEPVPTPLDRLADQEKPGALDRAALEACAGGGFFPGIEIGRTMLDESTYDRHRPFRVNAQLAPGTLTARMAVPWQADFNDCTMEGGMDWWPAQRPNQVCRGKQQEDWQPPNWEHEDMVQNWSQLGFVVERKTKDGVSYVEGERSIP